MFKLDMGQAAPQCPVGGHVARKMAIGTMQELKQSFPKCASQHVSLSVCRCVAPTLWKVVSLTSSWLAKLNYFVVKWCITKKVCGQHGKLCAKGKKAQAKAS